MVGEAFRSAVAFVGEQCLDPADPVTAVTTLGYLGVSQAFQCGSALAEEWMSAKATEHRGLRRKQVEADKALQVVEGAGVDSMGWDLEVAFQDCFGEVVQIMAVPVEHPLSEVEQCHFEAVSVLQEVVELVEPAPTVHQRQSEWL